jgi:hypothetical protein
LTQGNIQVHPDALNDVSATRALLEQEAANNDQRRRNRTQLDENIQCPICLGEAELPTEVIKAHH